MGPYALIFGSQFVKLSGENICGLVGEGASLGKTLRFQKPILFSVCCVWLDLKT